MINQTSNPKANIIVYDKQGSSLYTEYDWITASEDEPVVIRYIQKLSRAAVQSNHPITNNFIVFQNQTEVIDDE